MFFKSTLVAIIGACYASARSVHVLRQTTPVSLHPNGQLGKCLSVRDGEQRDGAVVELYNCRGFNDPAQTWEITGGSTKVRLAGTNFCLDAGLIPRNGAEMNIWTCSSILIGQQWFYTDERRISLEGRGQCLELPDGDNSNGVVIRTSSCSSSNSNQIWTYANPANPPPTTPPATSNPTAPGQIHPNGNLNKCIDVRAGIIRDSIAVQIYDCNGSAAQRWQINSGNTKVQLAGTNFCLDAGTNPKNGVGMKIATCYPNLNSQKWVYSGGNQIQLAGTNQCLDLPSGNTFSGNRLQTWECGQGSASQVWTL